MSTTLTTASSGPSLGTSHVRGSSARQTRNLPARTSRNVRPNLRQNSLVSHPAQSAVQGAPHVEPDSEPHGFYPAIAHFTDAITALPRDFRRHTSLLKEVDAKAWALEENLQKLLKQCLHERQSRPLAFAAQTIPGSSSSVAGDLPAGSIAGSVNGTAMDTASQYSTSASDPEVLQRRRLYAELRSNLMQMIMPLDEKNHVINNANDELSKQIRRHDEIWPHLTDEISEETRLGSLRHWALTDLNPTKKTQAVAARNRELAIAQDNEVAERSERRREAMLAKSKKTTQHVDSDVETRRVTKKTGKKQLELEDVLVNPPVALIGNLPGVKVNKGRNTAQKKGEEQIRKLVASAAPTSIPMSRENSQQETSKKRKAPTTATAVARKRINAITQESPKLGHSPLVGEPYKKSPALSNAKLANGRARQNSAQSAETANKPAVSASRRNGVTATGSELERVATATGKTPNEVKHTMRETQNSKGEKMLEEDVPDNVENRIRGGIVLERSASKPGQLRKEEETIGRRTASPRLHAAATIDTKAERSSKSKANKTSTPTVATFAEADRESESAAEAAFNAEYGNDFSGGSGKLKRPVRPRIKDHHGLHDSLSPKGLPTKRMHKKHASYSLSQSFSNRSAKDEELSTTTERKPTTSRANSRPAKTSESREGRNASATPKIGGPSTDLVDEPESLASTNSDDAAVKPVSRRPSANPKHSNTNSLSHSTATTTFDVRPPTSSRASNHNNTTTVLSSTPVHSPALKASVPRDLSQSLGSPGPDIVDDADIEHEEEVADLDEEDPNEARYCYCNGVSYGEMVACDNDSCTKEWFHLECTGLRSLPPARSTWYCDECKRKMR